MKRLAIFCLVSTLSVPATAGTLHVLALRSQPFFFDDGGEPAGIEAEILEYFAKTRGDVLDVEYAEDFPSLLTRIEKGEADIAAGTITITAEREKRMDFSAPYFPVQVVLVERTDEASATLADLKGKKVAAFRETTAEDALREVPGVEIVQLSGVPGMLDAIRNGAIDGAAADSSAIIPVLDDYPGLTISLTFGEEQHFGFALPKGSELTGPLSEHVRSLKASGIYFRLVTKHMGPRASAIVRAARSQLR